MRESQRKVSKKARKINGKSLCSALDNFFPSSLPVKLNPIKNQNQFTFAVAEKKNLRTEHEPDVAIGILLT